MAHLSRRRLIRTRLLPGREEKQSLDSFNQSEWTDTESSSPVSHSSQAVDKDFHQSVSSVSAPNPSLLRDTSPPMESTIDEVRPTSSVYSQDARKELQEYLEFYDRATAVLLKEYPESDSPLRPRSSSKARNKETQVQDIALPTPSPSPASNINVRAASPLLPTPPQSIRVPSEHLRTVSLNKRETPLRALGGPPFLPEELRSRAFSNPLPSRRGVAESSLSIAPMRLSGDFSSTFDIARQNEDGIERSPNHRNRTTAVESTRSVAEQTHEGLSIAHHVENIADHNHSRLKAGVSSEPSIHQAPDISPQPEHVAADYLESPPSLKAKSQRGSGVNYSSWVGEEPLANPQNQPNLLRRFASRAMRGPVRLSRAFEWPTQQEDHSKESAKRSRSLLHFIKRKDSARQTTEGEEGPWRSNDNADLGLGKRSFSIYRRTSTRTARSMHSDRVANARRGVEDKIRSRKEASSTTERKRQSVFRRLFSPTKKPTEAELRREQLRSSMTVIR